MRRFAKPPPPSRRRAPSGVLAVEMEAAALYAFARKKNKAVLCLAQVTNTMGLSRRGFRKGRSAGNGRCVDDPRSPRKSPVFHGRTRLTRLALFRQSIELHQTLKKRRHVLERHHVGAIGGRVVRVLMGLDEDAGDADGDRGASQHRHEVAVAAGGGSLPARLLHRMGGIEDHRAPISAMTGSARMSETSVL